MAKPIQRPPVHHLKAVYTDYANRLLDEHPDWWGKYGDTVKLRNCYIYAMENGKPVLKMSLYLWREVVSSFYYKSKDAIIQGETLRLGSGLGKLRAIRVQRNFNKPVVDWGATKKANIVQADGTLKRIYYTNEDYCRVQWRKYGLLTNETSYSFDLAEANTKNKKGIKLEFSRALDEFPLLRYRYKYYPIRQRKKKTCNTPTVQ